MNIETSSTFMLDLDSLKHPDDVKKDEFGRWLYSGSHVQTYLAWKENGDKLKFEKTDSDDGDQNNFSYIGFAANIPLTPNFSDTLR